MTNLRNVYDKVHYSIEILHPFSITRKKCPLFLVSNFTIVQIRVSKLFDFSLLSFDPVYLTFEY